jgi:sodium transport system ATP-binding protein
MIEVNQLTKVFDLTKKQRKELATTDKKAIAVDDISFKCKPGRIFSLLGPNGAGKTTTLRILATIFQPSQGTVSICGINTLEQPQLAKRKIGFLTGSTGLYARLTPNELIKYFADLYGVSAADFEKRKAYLYTLLNMHELSTGMKQKVSICRTMIHDPEVVIFDEPTSGLDVITAKNIIQLIQDCKDQGKTVIFSSHIMSEVDLLCDDLAIIHKGKIVYAGEMNDFRAEMQAQNLTAEFIRIIESSTN